MKKINFCLGLLFVFTLLGCSNKDIDDSIKDDSIKVDPDKVDNATFWSIPWDASNGEIIKSLGKYGLEHTSTEAETEAAKKLVIGCMSSWDIEIDEQETTFTPLVFGNPKQLTFAGVPYDTLVFGSEEKNYWGAIVFQNLSDFDSDGKKIIEHLDSLYTEEKGYFSLPPAEDFMMWSSVDITEVLDKIQETPQYIEMVYFIKGTNDTGDDVICIVWGHVFSKDMFGEEDN